MNPSLPTSAVSLGTEDLLRRSADALKAAEMAEEAAGRKDLEKTEEAIREFESFFIFYLMKVMRETVPKTGLLTGGSQEDTFTSLLDQEFARGMAASGGLGLGDLLRDQLLGEDWRLSKEADTESHEEGPAFGPPSNRSDLLPPLRMKISSPFGMRRDPITLEPKFHEGVDIPAVQGTPVRASASGRVIFSGVRGGYGKVVIIDHGNGLESLYAHNSKNLVSTGQPVRGGEAVALVGSTGRSTGPHLHFEVRKGGDIINPLKLL